MSDSRLRWLRGPAPRAISRSCSSGARRAPATQRVRRYPGQDPAMGTAASDDALEKQSQLPLPSIFGRQCNQAGTTHPRKRVVIASDEALRDNRAMARKPIWHTTVIALDLPLRLFRPARGEDSVASPHVSRYLPLTSRVCAESPHRTDRTRRSASGWMLEPTPLPALRGNSVERTTGQNARTGCGSQDAPGLVALIVSAGSATRARREMGHDSLRPAKGEPRANSNPLQVGPSE